MHSLDPLFKPRSVAIIGASNDPNKVGGRPLSFLLRAGFRGAIYPVNPSASTVQGVAAFASLEAIGVPIDQVIIAVPAVNVPDVARQCMRSGVKALQIFSAGFGEGDDAARSAAALFAEARACGTRVLGPNSLGLFSTGSKFFGTFATALDGAWPKDGSVGVVTQSGAFGSYFFGLAQQRGLGFSHFVATGNEGDIDIADCISWMAGDPATSSIVTAMEGCKDGRKLASALGEAHAAGKPVLAMKVGVSKAGARAAATHTGSLSGEDRVFDAVLRDAGAHRLQSLEALVDAACTASIGPLPQGREVLIMTTSGGIGVLAADAAEAEGLELPGVSEQALADMRRVAPLADGHNPVDTSAGIIGDLSAYARILELALADRSFDAVVCYLAHIARNPAHWAQLREPLIALRTRYPQMPFLAVLLSSDEIGNDLESHGFSVHSDPTRAVRALSACVRLPCRVSDAVRPREKAELRIGGMASNEHEAKSALGALGIRFAPERIVRTAGEAVAAAESMGYPAVLKIVSPDIPHKTEAGGVQLGIMDSDALAKALPAMEARVKCRVPTARIDGFLVARQLQGGVELLIGCQSDPVFGPVITVGAGGVMAELLQDVQVRLAPVTEATAREMLAATRAGQLCEGFRGSMPGDVDAVAAQVALLSEIAWTNREVIDAIDLNPVLVMPDGAFALDALIAYKPREATR